MRVASCSCKQLTVSCEGEPLRISMCHCLECQRRTGSAFGVQARFAASGVKMQGHATEYQRVGDSGGRVTFRFCPRCGTTVYWTIDAVPDAVGVAVGAFADPSFPPPRVSVYGARRHPWTMMPGLEVTEHD
jgi:hypothetical protein